MWLIEWNQVKKNWLFDLGVWLMMWTWTLTRWIRTSQFFLFFSWPGYQTLKCTLNDNAKAEYFYSLQIETQVRRSTILHIRPPIVVENLLSVPLLLRFSSQAGHTPQVWLDSTFNPIQSNPSLTVTIVVVIFGFVILIEIQIKSRSNLTNRLTGHEMRTIFTPS